MQLNILVCVKQTFDTEEKIELSNGRIVDAGVDYILNPYDEYAVEEAIRKKEAFGGKVTVVTIGPDRAESVLRTALAMGADEALIVNDDLLADGDEFTNAKVLAAVARKEVYDLILAGCMSIDNGSSQTGSRLAEELGIPQVITATQLEIDGSRAVVKKDVEGDAELIEAPLPMLVTAQQGLNEPRYPSLPNIMKAKKKPLERLTIEDLGIDQATIAAKTSITDRFLPPKRQAGTILSGEIDEQVKSLVQMLRNDAKVI